MDHCEFKNVLINASGELLIPNISILPCGLPCNIKISPQCLCFGFEGKLTFRALVICSDIAGGFSELRPPRRWRFRSDGLPFLHTSRNREKSIKKTTVDFPMS